MPDATLIGYNVGMPSTSKPRELWGKNPADHDYAAARDYLSLQYDPEVSEALVGALREAPTVRTYKAKDILRASGLQPLERRDFDVAAELTKINSGKKLSPVLLVRDVDRHVLVVADGFHRVCASRVVDEDAIIPARVVTTP